MKSRRHVLLIADLGFASPYWPQFCEHLANLGQWDVTVVTPSMSRAQRRFFNIPTSKERNYQILETKSFKMQYRRNNGLNRYLRKLISIYESVRIKAMKMIGLQLFPAKGHSEWIIEAVSQAHNLHRDNPIDLVMSTCLPFETHVIGSQISKSLNIPWIADYRDPFTFSHTRSTEPSLVEIEFEKKVLSTASMCTTTSIGFGKEISKVFAGPVKVIHNGFDEIQTSTFTKFGSPIKIVYHGSIYENFQRVDLIIQAMQSVFERLQIGNNFPIILQFGGFSTHVVVKYLESQNIECPEWLRFVGVTSVHEARRIQQGADFLLLLNWEDPKQTGVMQTKLYEYISSGIPVIATGGSGDDESSSLLKSAGNSFIFTDIESICGFLLNLLEGNFTPSARNESFIRRYSRTAQAEILCGFMNSVSFCKKDQALE